MSLKTSPAVALALMCLASAQQTRTERPDGFRGWASLGGCQGPGKARKASKARRRRKKKAQRRNR